MNKKSYPNSFIDIFQKLNTQNVFLGTMNYTSETLTNLTILLIERGKGQVSTFDILGVVC
jgi:hypothetical protein